MPASHCKSGSQVWLPSLAAKSGMASLAQIARGEIRQHGFRRAIIPGKRDGGSDIRHHL